MRVLILRPEPQGSEMAARLAACGIGSLVCPMLRIETEPDAARQVLAAKPRGLVATSAAAVRAVAGAPDGPEDPQEAALRRLPIYTVGPATAAAAREAGFVSIREADGDARALIRRILDDPARPGGTLVHMAGRDRAVEIGTSLKEAGVSAATVEVYRAEADTTLDPAARQALAAGDIDAVVVASARTAGAFRRCVEEAGLDLGPAAPVLVAISKAAADPLKPFFERVSIAARPDGDSLVEAVVALASPVVDNAADSRPAALPQEKKDADAMASDNDPHASDPIGRTGRRRSRPTTIDLKAAEVKAVEPEPAPASPADEASGQPAPATASPADAPSVESAGDAIFVGDAAEPPAHASADGEPAAPASTSVADDASAAPTEPSAPTTSSATESATSASEPIADPSAGSAKNSTDRPASPPPAAPPPPAERGRTSVAALVAAGVIGGVVALAAAAGLSAAGVLPALGPAAEDGTAALEASVANLEAELAALRDAPAPVPDQGPLQAVAERLAGLETRVEALGASTASADTATALEGVRTDLAGLVERIGALEASPAPADPGPRIDTVAGAVDTVRREAEATRSTIDQLAAQVTTQVQAIEEQAVRLQEQGTALTAQSERVTALENRPEPPTVEPERVAALETTVPDLAGRVDRVDTELAALSGRVGAMETATADARADLRAATDTFSRDLAESVDPLKSDVAALRADLEPLTGSVPDIESRLAAVEKRLEAAPREGEIATLSLAVTALSSRLAAGAPFAEDLAVLKAAATDLPDVSALEAVAEGGVPTDEALAERFPLQAILSARPAPAEAGVLDRMLIGAKSIVNYRETGSGVTDDLSQPLDRLTTALEDGDLPAAAEAWGDLPDYAREKSADWKADLDRRIAAEAAMAALSDTVLERLKAGTGAAEPVAN